MIVLKPILTAQTIQFIGRYDNADLIVLKDEQDNTEVEVFADFNQYKYYLTADVILDLKENRFYNLKIYKTVLSDYQDRVINDGGVVESLECLVSLNGNNRVEVYRDKIFCTSQTDYSINNNEYVQHVSNNDYITI